MSPMYGYGILRSSVTRKNEFVEVALSDSTIIEKGAGSGMMDTALVNPCYQSSDDLSNEKKVDFPPIHFRI